MLTVLDDWSDKVHRYCKVQCDCGTIKTVRRSSMKPGQTVSCGCYAIEHFVKTGQDPRSPMLGLEQNIEQSKRVWTSTSQRKILLFPIPAHCWAFL
jgi:hypothetical protein